MQLLYIYDIKAKDKRSFNRAKRVFYYRLNKLSLPKSAFLTKSTIIINEKDEHAMDKFFKDFKGAITNFVSVFRFIDKKSNLFIAVSKLFF